MVEQGRTILSKTPLKHKYVILETNNGSNSDIKDPTP